MCLFIYLFVFFQCQNMSQYIFLIIGKTNKNAGNGNYLLNTSYKDKINLVSCNIHIRIIVETLNLHQILISSSNNTYIYINYKTCFNEN